MDGQAIILAKDRDLTSLRDGRPDIFWSDVATLGTCLGAKGIRVYLNVLGLGAGTSLAFVGRFGIDGRTWTNFWRQIDGRTTGNPINAVGSVVNDYAAGPEEFAPSTSFGIQVTGDVVGVVQGTVRLSAVIVPIFTDALLVSINLAYAAALAAGQTRTVLGDRQLVSSFKRAVLIADVTAFAGANTITLYIQGSDDLSNFYDLGNSGAIAANGLYPIELNTLTKYIRLVYSSGAGTTATLAATLEAKTI